MGAPSATGSWERKSVFEPLVPGFLHHHPPHAFRDLAGVLGTAPTDEACALASARLLERTIEAEDPETVAAVIVEPISVSSAGFAVPHPAYFRELRATCDRHDVLLIFDEIITGFGRLGEWFGADYLGVAPDLLCCGKGMGGATPPLRRAHLRAGVGGFPGRARSAPGVPPRAHLRRESGRRGGGVRGDRRDRGPRSGGAGPAPGGPLRARLEALAREFPDAIGEVRGAGLLQGFEFNAQRFPKADRPGKRFEALARERGLLARCDDEFVAFAPPLVIERAEPDELLDVSTDCLHALAD